MTYSLRVWWKLPELSDRLIVRDSRNQECRAFFEKSGRDRIGITLLRQLNKILDISDSEAGLIVEKSGGVFGDKDECGDDNNNNNNNQYIYKQRQSHAMSQRRWLATAVIFRPSDVSLGFAGT